MKCEYPKPIWMTMESEFPTEQDFHDLYVYLDRRNIDPKVFQFGIILSPDQMRFFMNEYINYFNPCKEQLTYFGFRIKVMSIREIEKLKQENHE